MSQKNKELILTYDLLLKIARSLKIYKKRFDDRKEDPEEELRSLIYSIKFCEDESIDSVVLENANDILSEEDENVRYAKMEILIRKIKDCIYDMKEGKELYEIYILIRR